MCEFLNMCNQHFVWIGPDLHFLHTCSFCRYKSILPEIWDFGSKSQNEISKKSNSSKMKKTPISRELESIQNTHALYCLTYGEDVNCLNWILPMFVTLYLFATFLAHLIMAISHLLAFVKQASSSELPEWCQGDSITPLPQLPHLACIFSFLPYDQFWLSSPLPLQKYKSTNKSPASDFFLNQCKMSDTLPTREHPKPLQSWTEFWMLGPMTEMFWKYNQ